MYPPSSTPTQEQPPSLSPAVELYPVPEVAQQMVDVQRFEQYSIAAAIHQMFAQAEQGVGQPIQWEQSYEEEYPNDTEAFRMYMKEVHIELKGSLAVQTLRQAVENHHEVTKSMVEEVFTAYGRAVSAAAERLRAKLRPDQITQLKQAGRNNLDWSYRGLLLERLTQDEGAPTRYSLEDFFLILNPKARKVQYMERPEILKSLRYTMSLGTTEQLKNDVQLAREFAHEDMGGETITDSDLQPFATTTY